MSSIKIASVSFYPYSVFDTRYNQVDYDNSCIRSIVQMIENASQLQRQARINGNTEKWCYSFGTNGEGLVYPRKPFNFISIDDNDLVRKVQTYPGMYIRLEMADEVDCGMEYGLFKLIEIGFN